MRLLYALPVARAAAGADAAPDDVRADGLAGPVGRADGDARAKHRNVRSGDPRREGDLLRARRLVLRDRGVNVIS